MAWYNSEFFSKLGTGLGIAAVCLGVGYGTKSCSSSDVAVIRAQNERVLQLQQGDLNGNGVSDKFYVIDGKIAVVEMDGMPVSKSLDSKVEK